MQQGRYELRIMSGKNDECGVMSYERWVMRREIFGRRMFYLLPLSLVPNSQTRVMSYELRIMSFSFAPNT